MMKKIVCFSLFLSMVTYSSFAAKEVVKPVKQSAKEICLDRAKEQIFKLFKKKADLGNDFNNPWSFVIEDDGCSYVVSVKLNGTVEDCKLSDFKKDSSPSRCEGE